MTKPGLQFTSKGDISGKVSMEVFKGTNTVKARSAKEWRKWLSQNHDKEKSVWLILYKKDSGKKTVFYPEAVDEALCFGWVDSLRNKRDDESYYQYFAQRRKNSNWSKINKEKVARLLEEGKMTPSGMKLVDIAKANGKWNVLDDVEEIVVPDDLKVALESNVIASDNWEKYPRSAKRRILIWLLGAKKEETRIERIKQVIAQVEKDDKFIPVH